LCGTAEPPKLGEAGIYTDPTVYEVIDEHTLILDFCNTPGCIDWRPLEKGEIRIRTKASPMRILLEKP
jgi:hypothetical protein